MNDRKLKKRGKTDASVPNKMTKEEDAIARFIRFNCPTNSTIFEGNEVHYFSGKKAVDLLVESKKYGTAAKIPKFSNNVQAEDFLQGLLERGLFFRARKVVLKKKDKTAVDEKKKSTNNKDLTKSPRNKHVSQGSPKPDKNKSKNTTNSTEKDKTEKEDDDAEGEETKEETGKGEEKQEEEKKKKKKVKLIAHDIQSFVLDPSDVYVWIFDPTPFYKKLIGLLIVLGTIAGCLFPLWPDWLRLGIYYLSVTGIICFGVLLGMALARTILFGIIYACTMGRHKLWVLPNLTEDCGFFESFKPFYTYEYVSGGAFGESASNKKKKLKEKKSGKTAIGDGKAIDAEENVPSTSAKHQNNLYENDEVPLDDDKCKRGNNKGSNEDHYQSQQPKGKSNRKRRPSTEENISEDEDQTGSGKDSSGQEDEGDENHLSDETSDEGDGSSLNSNEENHSEQEEPSPKVRHRRQGQKKQKKDGSPTGEEDFVIIESSAQTA